MCLSAGHLTCKIFNDNSTTPSSDAYKILLICKLLSLIRSWPVWASSYEICKIFVDATAVQVQVFIKLLRRAGSISLVIACSSLAISVWFCLWAPVYGSTLWCALGLLVEGAVEVLQLQLQRYGIQKIHVINQSMISSLVKTYILGYRTELVQSRTA